MTTPLQNATPPLVLASGSCARAALLRGAGLSFEVLASTVDESPLKREALARGLDHDATALLLAAAKAREVAHRRPGALVIGADQLLACDGRRFDKPCDQTEAATQLRALSNRTHTLHSAVVLVQNGTSLWQHVAVPRLRLRALSERFIDAYLEQEGEAVLSCVGSYRLEALGIQLFEQVEGEHAAILGLPLLALLAALRRQGLLAT